MTKKQTQSLALVLLVVVVAALVWFFKTKGPKTEANPPANSQDQTQNSNKQPSSPQTQSSNTWEGTLKASDNSKKGNLMLVTDNKTIYMQTSRNFSALIGKQVVVSYEGNANSFTLLNITAK